jgi:hypothetical protein
MRRRRKPTPVERELLYMGAKDEAFRAGDDMKAGIKAAQAWLENIPWLHRQSVDGITAKVAERLAHLQKTGVSTNP